MIELRSVGVVERGETCPRDIDAWRESECLIRSVAAIRVYPEFCKALEGVREGALYWMLRLADTAKGECATVHLLNNSDEPEMGVFSARSPYRPNTIGLSFALVTARTKCVLCVIGPDAYGESPVLDIRPYAPGYDDP